MSDKTVYRKIMQIPESPDFFYSCSIALKFDGRDASQSEVWFGYSLLVT